jgi:hypothetical protein
LVYGNRDKIVQDLKLGDIVERHLIDGDIAQTLHHVSNGHGATAANILVQLKRLQRGF